MSSHESVQSGNENPSFETKKYEHGDANHYSQLRDDNSVRTHISYLESMLRQSEQECGLLAEKLRQSGEKEISTFMRFEANLEQKFRGVLSNIEQRHNSQLESVNSQWQQQVNSLLANHDLTKDQLEYHRELVHNLELQQSKHKTEMESKTREYTVEQQRRYQEIQVLMTDRDEYIALNAELRKKLYDAEHSSKTRSKFSAGVEFNGMVHAPDTSVPSPTTRHSRHIRHHKQRSDTTASNSSQTTSPEAKTIQSPKKKRGLSSPNNSDKAAASSGSESETSQKSTKKDKVKNTKSNMKSDIDIQQNKKVDRRANRIENSGGKKSGTVRRTEHAAAREQEVEHLIRSFADLQVAYTDAQGESDELANHAVELMDKLDSMLQALRSTQAELVSTSEDLADAVSEIHEKDEYIADLEQQLTAVIQQHRQLGKSQTQHAQTNTDEDLTATSSAASKPAEQLPPEAQVPVLAPVPDDNFEAELKMNQARLDAAEKTNQELKAALDKAIAHAEQYKASKKQLKKDLSHSLERIDELNMRAQWSSDEQDKMQKRLTEAESRAAGAEAALKEALMLAAPELVMERPPAHSQACPNNASDRHKSAHDELAPIADAQKAVVTKHFTDSSTQAVCSVHMAETQTEFELTNTRLNEIPETAVEAPMATTVRTPEPASEFGRDQGVRRRNSWHSQGSLTLTGPPDDTSAADENGRRPKSAAAWLGTGGEDGFDPEQHSDDEENAIQPNSENNITDGNQQQQQDEMLWPEKDIDGRFGELGFLNDPNFGYEHDNMVVFDSEAIGAVIGIPDTSMDGGYGANDHIIHQPMYGDGVESAPSDRSENYILQKKLLKTRLNLANLAKELEKVIGQRDALLIRCKEYRDALRSVAHWSRPDVDALSGVELHDIPPTYSQTQQRGRSPPGRRDKASHIASTKPSPRPQWVHPPKPYAQPPIKVSKADPDILHPERKSRKNQSISSRAISELHETDVIYAEIGDQTKHKSETKPILQNATQQNQRWMPHSPDIPVRSSSAGVYISNSQRAQHMQRHKQVYVSTDSMSPVKDSAKTSAEISSLPATVESYLKSTDMNSAAMWLPTSHTHVDRPQTRRSPSPEMESQVRSPQRGLGVTFVDATTLLDMPITPIAIKSQSGSAHRVEESNRFKPSAYDANPTAIAKSTKLSNTIYSELNPSHDPDLKLEILEPMIPSIPMSSNSNTAGQSFLNANVKPGRRMTVREAMQQKATPIAATPNSASGPLISTSHKHDRASHGMSDEHTRAAVEVQHKAFFTSYPAPENTNAMSYLEQVHDRSEAAVSVAEAVEAVQVTTLPRPQTARTSRAPHIKVIPEPVNAITDPVLPLPLLMHLQDPINTSLDQQAALNDYQQLTVGFADSVGGAESHAPASPESSLYHLPNEHDRAGAEMLDMFDQEEDVGVLLNKLHVGDVFETNPEHHVLRTQTEWGAPASTYDWNPHDLDHQLLPANITPAIKMLAQSPVRSPANMTMTGLSPFSVPLSARSEPPLAAAPLHVRPIAPTAEHHWFVPPPMTSRSDGPTIVHRNRHQSSPRSEQRYEFDSNRRSSQDYDEEEDEADWASNDTGSEGREHDITQEESRNTTLRPRSGGVVPLLPMTTSIGVPSIIMSSGRAKSAGHIRSHKGTPSAAYVARLKPHTRGEHIRQQPDFSHKPAPGALREVKDWGILSNTDARTRALRKQAPTKLW